MKMVPNEITAIMEPKFVGKFQTASGPPTIIKIDTARNKSFMVSRAFEIILAMVRIVETI